MAHYGVELSGEAWKAVGELSAEAFGDLRQALNRLASEPTLRAAGYDLTDSGRYTPTYQAGTLNLHYTVDHATKKILVHRVLKISERVA